MPCSMLLLACLLQYKDLCNIVLHSAIIIVRQLNDLQNILIILLEPREKLLFVMRDDL